VRVRDGSFRDARECFSEGRTWTYTPARAAPSSCFLLPQVCHLCRPTLAPWPPPSPALNGGTSGHYACLWGTRLSPRRSPAPPTPDSRPRTGTGCPAEPRHCRHLVGVRCRIALKHMGFQHQQTKTSPFGFGIGSVGGIETENPVTLLRLSRTPCWTVNP